MTASKNGNKTQFGTVNSNMTVDNGVYQPESRGKSWAIVLAGGRGERMREAISEWLGSNRPKQFCRFTGEHSMLENTWDRARQLVGNDHIVTVSVADQAMYFEELDVDTIPGTVLYQPEHNGTAAAVYLALAHILALDPDASVIILPSDHFIFPEANFVALARTALGYVAADPEHLILLGAEARWPNTDFGWIKPAVVGSGSQFASNAVIQPVLAFIEKPDNQQARHLYSNNALWSTMIIATKGELLWQLAKVLHPKFYFCFLYLHRLTLQERYGTMQKEAVDNAVGKTFKYMPELDFSKDLLQNITQQCLVLPMTDIDWDDWGRPERILQSIERYGLDSWLNDAGRSMC
ncbi:mannose-1-phosphate guanylyltransferase [Arsukibacterium tuosuense]|uniref:Mannose-1-phosphate guanylyltransferase n=1 Tax=Arsukibacterium tuosuense TaxID=1323745 RepID=A0A285ITK9_9GAMM|nr:sugar phosphate nucleotidyltransferase [Arsukibacterium tuosuense]SNY51322.1 mannose-1-phosphate guanylyltransferase [Arsukibacterium tuosuense]